MKKVFTLLEKKTWASLIFLLLFQTVVIGQSLSHPHIWVSQSDKQEILDNIGTYDWAQSLYNQYKSRVDSKVNTHISNPSTILNTIPDIPGVYANRGLHNDILTSAGEAAILFYLTDNTDYAQYAADILSHYMQQLAVQPSRFYSGGTGLFYDDWWLESRSLFPKIAVIYDFVYNYVNSDTVTIYDLNAASRISFDNNIAQTTVRTLSNVVLKSIGASNSNWSVLAGNGALFNLMMIDDDTERENYFQRFYKQPNNERFDAYQWTLATFTNQNIWDETFSYSKSVSELVMQSLNVIDRFKPELDIVNKNIRILDGYPLYENLYYPNGDVLRFGDSGSDIDLTKGYQWMLKVATRKNLPEYAQFARQALKFEYDMKGGYQPKVATDALGWWNPLQLLWGTHVSDTVTPKPPTIIPALPVNHAGLLIQRNYNTGDIKLNGLMCYTGGATYVHAHRSGIDMELYGKGLVLGAESGSGTYRTDEHDNYRTRIAAHNTVIANRSGKSGGTWGTRMNKVITETYEPEIGHEPVSTKFSFSSQYLDDTYNNCKQQRTVSIIRTGTENGYYFDLFRSKGNTFDDSHDYIYHNIGDAVTLTDSEGAAIPLTASTKYSTDISGSVTGWKFFENVKSSATTTKAVKARFSLNDINTYMHVTIPEGVEREYATALAPTTKGAPYNYEKQKTPVMTIRQTQEAWNKPFIAVYEPSLSTNSTIQSVKNIEVNGKLIGAVVSSLVNGIEISDIIISLEKEDTVYIPDYFIGFKGRFGIVRKQKQTETTETITLYIGDGEELTYADKNLKGGVEKKSEIIFFGVPSTTGDSRFTLNVTVFGGGGTISVSPDKESYLPGEQVQIQAVPDAGNVLDEWLGDAEGSNNIYTLTMFSNKSVFARFRIADYVELNVSTENGEVAQSIPGTQFVEQTEIELTAIPNEGYAFESWSGDYTGTENPLTISLDSSINITANFSLNTSISEALSNSIIVSPNPSNGVFAVQVPIANTWSVYDISGKIVESGNSDGSFELDLTSFKKSMYILSIRTNNSVAVKRIFVK